MSQAGIRLLHRRRALVIRELSGVRRKVSVLLLVYDSGQLGSIEMVEINPIFDDRNQTASLAVDLICSALGKSIL